MEINWPLNFDPKNCAVEHCIQQVRSILYLNSIFTKMSSKRCHNLDCKKVGSHTCAGCNYAIYCSKECQVNHWDAHKPVCKAKKADSSNNLVAAGQNQTHQSLTVKQLKHIIRSKTNDYPDAERKQIIEEMGKLVEKEPLVELAEKHVKPSEIAKLLSTLPDKGGAAPVVSSSSGRRQGSRQAVREEEVDMTKATPKQLREQANFLRKYPDMARRQQPALAHMSNAELIEAAQQLEELADNPNKMNEFKEAMSKMSPEEKEMMKNMSPEQREQVKNLTPEQKEMMKNITPEQKKERMKLAHMSPKDKKHLTVFQEGMTGNIDSKWITSVIALLKSNPQVFKTLSTVSKYTLFLCVIHMSVFLCDYIIYWHQSEWD